MNWPPEGDGILPSQSIREVIARGAVISSSPIGADQIQPNSLDLRLSSRAWRIQCSFLPLRGVSRHLESLAWYPVEIGPEGHVLEPGQVWLIELDEALALPPSLSARSNPKSSTGRLDVFARVIPWQGEAYDAVPAGYSGKLYLEIAPRSFAVRVRPGDCLAQLRLQVGDPHLDDDAVRRLLEREAIVVCEETPERRPTVDQGIALSVRTRGEESNPQATVGFRARASSPPIDLRERDVPIDRHWERILARPSVPLILEVGAFYIFSSRERVRLPPGVCAEMVPFDASRGEVRTHYAGFFDSGFGYAADLRPDLSAGAVVLEVRNRDVPFVLEHGQSLFRLEILRNLAPPDLLYGGSRLASSYQSQRLRLSKQFARPPEDGPSEHQLPLPFFPGDP